MNLESSVSGVERESESQRNKYYTKQIEMATNYLNNHGRMYARNIAKELVKAGYREKLETEQPELFRILRMGGL